MAKITTVKKIILGDFPKEPQKWLNKLIQPINDYLEQSIKALQNGITTADNLKCKIISTTIEKGYSVTTSAKIKVAYPLNERPSFVALASIFQEDGLPMSTATSIQWEYDTSTGGAQLLITVAGLAAPTTQKYTITLLAMV